MVAVGDQSVTVARERGDQVEVELALTFPYTPRPGDELLVISEANEHFAIGVLGAAAPTTLDLGEAGELSAGGVLTLTSDDALDVEAPRVALRARALRTFATRLTERASRVDTWVRGLLTERAGEVRRVVEETDQTQAVRSVTLASGKVKIDADTLNVGH